MDETFDDVYARYGGRIHAFLARLSGDSWLAEELCQETFVRYLQHRDRLRGSNGSLPTWLYRVATNLYRDSLRRRRPEAVLADPPCADRAAEAAETRDLADAVRREVSRLQPELREAFLLRAHEGLTFPELARALGVSEGTAKSRWKLARDILAHRLEDSI